MTSLLVLSSLFIFAPATPSASAALPSESVTDAQSGHYTRLAPDWDGITWDWAQYADLSGYVNAIIADDDLTALGRLEASHPEQVGVEFDHSFKGFSVRMPLADLTSMLAADPSVQAYPDLVLNASLAVSVPAIGADQVWSNHDAGGHLVKGYGILVAVIDTGVDYLHPDLGGGFGPGFKVVGGYDFYNNDANPMDDNGHGTHVAGIIAANGGVVGVAPDASILAYKALGSGGSGAMSLVIKAIEAAMDPNDDGSTADHADIISMSLGGPGEADDPICMAVESAIAAGVVVVCAAGNSGPNQKTVASPGLAPDAITVGAVDDSGKLASFSSRGPTADLSIKPEVSAPGVGIDSTVPYSNAVYSSPSGHMALSGTSMAAPHVSGAAALLLQQHPDWTPAQVKSALVLGAKPISKSIWSAGAGEIWIPDSSTMNIFATEPVQSLGLATSKVVRVAISSSRLSSAYLSVVSQDYYALSANGSDPARVWLNISYASQSSLTIPAQGSVSLDLAVSKPSASTPEGYFDGWIVLSDGAREFRIPFGYIVLSQLSVHVNDLSGREVFDPYGGVWAIRTPDSGTVLSRRGNSGPAPPAEFLLPAGTYLVAASGHQLINDYSDPYLLSETVTIGALATKNITLNMSTAHKMTLDLATPDGHPIYVKDFRMYLRYVGTQKNASFDVTGTDYSVRGAAMFSLDKSKSVYVSDVPAKVGISVVGFSYSPDMWDFMERNWDHWYEWISGTSTAFYPEATADLQYLLAWEFESVTSASPTALSVDPARAHTYITKYDIPGVISGAWNNWGDHRSMGGESTFFIRRDTDTPVNNIFSGMNRTTIVQGPFTQLYNPLGLFAGYIERQFYNANYGHLSRANTASEIYVPDRAYLTEVGPGVSYDRLGSGPFYSSARIESSTDELTLYQPLLRDDDGARVGGAYQPSMRLYKNGGLVGIFELAEHLARPDALRVVGLSGSGAYKATIEYHPLTQIYDNVTVELGFNPSLADPNPPTMTGLSLPQKFVPGEAIGITFTGSDASRLTASAAWRTATSSPWIDLQVTSAGSSFISSLQTLSDTTTVGLRLRLTDASGNYMEYIADRVSLPETRVTFTLAPSVTDVELRPGDFTVPLTGSLRGALGGPLSTTSGVPIELWVGDRKVGMILDEEVSTGSHVHDGDIAFDWVLDPTRLFTAEGQTVTVTARFDLGTYQTKTSSFMLHSTATTDYPPYMSSSIADGSLMKAGALLPLEARDDGTVTSVTYSLDGGSSLPLAIAPVSAGVWKGDISTASWSEGLHTISATATDDIGLKSSVFSLSVQIDRYSPTIQLVNLSTGQVVPQGWGFEMRAADAHLASLGWQLDGGASNWKNGTASSAMVAMDTASLSVGPHVLKITAADSVGHRSWLNATFTVSDSSVVVSLISPLPGTDSSLFIRPGVPLNLSVIGTGTLSCTWTESGTVHDLQAPYSIPTMGWSEGAHEVLVNASNDFGNSDEITIALTVDGTPPTVSLAPANGTVMDTDDFIQIQAYDVNFDHLVWAAFSIAITTTNPDPQLVVGVHAEGPFTVGVTAVDKAGNSAFKLYSYVLDVNGPDDSIDPVPNFVSGSPLTITGYVHDAASQVTAVLMYELANHTFAQMVLTITGSSFTVTLAPELLWNGMQVYVIATDSAGHSTATPMVYLRASVSPPPPPPGNNETNQTNHNNGHKKPKKHLVALNGTQIVSREGFIAGTLLVFTAPPLVAFARRRKSSDDGEPDDRSPLPLPETHFLPSSKSPATAVGVGGELEEAWGELGSEAQELFRAPTPPGYVATAELQEDAQEIPEVREEPEEVPEVREEPERVVAPIIGRKTKTTPIEIEELLPSVPKETVKAALKPVEAREPEVDYGRLIEKELNSDVRKRSALDLEFEEFFEEREKNVDQDSPFLASGLKLKKLMEEEGRKKRLTD